MTGNREYKSDVFSMLLEYPGNALEIYNGLNGSEYKDESIVKIMTLDKGISLSVSNDASFIVGNEFNLYEHQSTHNPNMPIRHLIYLAKTLEQILRGRDLYSKKRITVPTPHFVVFYNGIEKRPEKEVFKLSDSFEKKTVDPEIDLICTVYNINPENNVLLLNKCPVLYGYMVFVEKIRNKVNNEVELKAAIDEAIDECIEEGILADFLISRRDEVTKTTMIDMTFETREKLFTQEAYEDGLAEGRKEGLKEGLVEGRTVLIATYLQNGGTEEDAIKLLNASSEEISDAKNRIKADTN